MICYKITNIVNGKIYIGITRCSLKKRWNEHKSKSRTSKSHLSKAISKYGFESFKIEIIKEFVNLNDLYDFEILQIEKFKSNDRMYGYNNSIGGERSSLGKKLSIDTRIKISKYQSLRERRPHTLETRKNMSEAAKGRDMSELIKLSVKNRKGNPSHNRIKVSQYDLNGLFLKTFNSITDAAKSVKGVATAFSAIKRGRLKTYKNFIWKFEE